MVGSDGTLRDLVGSSGAWWDPVGHGGIELAESITPFYPDSRASHAASHRIDQDSSVGERVQISGSQSNRPGRFLKAGVFRHAGLVCSGAVFRHLLFEGVALRCSLRLNELRKRCAHEHV